MRTHVHIFASSQLEGSYVADLLYRVVWGLIDDLIVLLIQDLVYSRHAKNNNGVGYWLSMWALESDCWGLNPTSSAYCCLTLGELCNTPVLFPYL